MPVQEVCLELLDSKGVTKYRRWYGSIQSARAVKSRLQAAEIQKSGDTWIIWTFERETSAEVLLWSSRPLGWKFVPVA